MNKQSETKTAGGDCTRPAAWRLVPVLVVLALGGVFFYALQTADPTRLPSALIGREAPALAVPAVEELVDRGRSVAGIEPVDFATGQPVVVNFWASWCAPCVAEHPLLVELKGTTNVSLLGVNYKDQPTNARRFLGRYGNPYDRVGADSDGRVAIEWGVYGMPETFVLDGQGRIVYKHVGQITRESLNSAILPAIERARKTPQTAEPPKR